MKKPLVSVEDVYTGFKTPTVVANLDAAKRDFKLLIIHPDTACPEDLRLWNIGEFDTETGKITPHKPEMIMKGEPHEH